jgi:hypothetical protein
MCNLHDLYGVEAIFLSPQAPLAFDRAGRVHQHTVEIEENGAAIESAHGSFKQFPVRL